MICVVLKLTMHYMNSVIIYDSEHMYIQTRIGSNGANAGILDHEAFSTGLS
jgi:hypothetical protein